jgi:hypothetical protein
VTRLKYGNLKRGQILYTTIFSQWINSLL